MKRVIIKQHGIYKRSIIMLSTYRQYLFWIIEWKPRKWQPYFPIWLKPSKSFWLPGHVRLSSEPWVRVEHFRTLVMWLGDTHQCSALSHFNHRLSRDILSSFGTIELIMFHILFTRMFTKLTSFLENFDILFINKPNLSQLFTASVRT